MLPACPGSSPGNPSPKWTCHEVPSQTFKLHQQHVYSERLQNDEAPPFFSKSESSQSPTLLTPHYSTRPGMLKLFTCMAEAHVLGSSNSYLFSEVNGTTSSAKSRCINPGHTKPDTFQTERKLTIKAIKRICDKDGDLDKIGRKDKKTPTHPPRNKTDC